MGQRLMVFAALAEDLGGFSGKTWQLTLPERIKYFFWPSMGLCYVMYIYSVIPQIKSKTLKKRNRS